jgi:hypothetical protein
MLTSINSEEQKSQDPEVKNADDALDSGGEDEGIEVEKIFSDLEM